ncbi:MAG: flagellar FliJ family protein [Candidatus Firestonebacteria bacterium]
MFIFKLEAALNYRKTLEEIKLVEFSEVKKKLEKEKELLAWIQAEQYATIEQIKNMKGHSFHASDIALYLSYIKLFKEKEILQCGMIEKVSKEVEILREALLEAVKNRKIMDNLKDRQLIEYNEDMAAYERKVEDETAVLRYIRNHV